MFENKMSIEDILNRNDRILLIDGMGTVHLSSLSIAVIL
jgi:hypothetical protein